MAWPANGIHEGLVRSDSLCWASSIAELQLSPKGMPNLLGKVWGLHHRLRFCSSVAGLSRDFCTVLMKCLAASSCILEIWCQSRSGWHLPYWQSSIATLALCWALIASIELLMFVIAVLQLLSECSMWWCSSLSLLVIPHGFPVLLDSWSHLVTKGCQHQYRRGLFGRYLLLRRIVARACFYR